MNIEKLTGGKKTIYILQKDPTRNELDLLFSDVLSLSTSFENDARIIFDISNLTFFPLTLARIILTCKKGFPNTLIYLNKDNKNHILRKIGFIDDDFVNSLETDGLTPSSFNSSTSLISENIDSVSNDFNPYVSFTDFLSMKVLSSPDGIVINHLGRSYTWKDIDELSDLVASDLSEMGACKASHIGLLGLNSANWIITFYAIQKLGALAVLINHHWRAGEISKAMSQTDADILCYGEPAYEITRDDFISEITSKPSNSIKDFYDIGNHIDFSSKKLAAEYTKESTHSDEAALIIFTSGSTSMPNAALLSPQCVMIGANTMAVETRQTKDDIMCLVSPLFHLFGFFQFQMACIDNIPVSFPKSVHSGDILETVMLDSCTLLHSVPNMFVALAAHKSLSRYDISTLRCCILAGAGILPSQMEQLLKTFKGTHFINMYGLSEMLLPAYSNYDESTEHLKHATGHPAKDVSIKISDINTGEYLPKNSEGEILLRNLDYQSSCYYNRPLNEQRIDSKGYFHTGDMGHIGDDGYLSITGRKKDIIIRSGENISPGEVAEALSLHPYVSSAEVVGIPNDFYGEEVCACIIPSKQGMVSAAELRSFLLDKLASFKIPGYYLTFDEFPLLGNGKTDKVTLKTLAIKKAKESL